MAIEDQIRHSGIISNCIGHHYVNKHCTLSVFRQSGKLSAFLSNVYKNEVIVLSVGFPNWYGNRRSDEAFRSYGLGIILIDWDRTRYVTKHALCPFFAKLCKLSAFFSNLY